MLLIDCNKCLDLDESEITFIEDDEYEIIEDEEEE